jgi:colicin import membrane protein
VNLAAPPPDNEESNWVAFVLAALVHLLLIGALFFGVQWKSTAPTSVAVEVWRAPPPAAVAKPEPKPEPVPEVKPEQKPEPKVEPTPIVKPDIAIKQEKKPKKEEPPKPEPKKEEPRKLEPKKEEPKKPEPKKEEPKREEPDFRKQLEADQKLIDQQKTAQDQRARAAAESDMRAQLKAEQASSGRASDEAAYGAKIRGKIKGNMSLAGLSIKGNPEAIFKVTQLPTGEILDVQLSKSSGNKALDEAIERAIRKSSPLPKPDQAELFQRILELKYKPLDE